MAASEEAMQESFQLTIPTDLLLTEPTLELDMEKGIILSTPSMNHHDGVSHQKVYQLKEEEGSKYLFRHRRSGGARSENVVYELDERHVRRCYLLSQNEAKDAEQIKDIGRKVRETLVKEKSNRREIVRLDDGEDLTGKLQINGAYDKPQKQKRKSGGIDYGKALKQVKTSPKRKRRRSTGADLPKNVDPWMPDLGSLLPQDGEPSHTIQMHGLPRGCTPADIARFFSGLEVELVFGIPSFDDCILEFDCEPVPAARKLLLPRYPPTKYRIFCKFPSAPLAQLASERNGEALFITTDNEKEMGAAVAVSVLSKHFSKHLLKYMAIDLQNKFMIQEDSSMVDAPVDRVLDRLEKQLYPGLTNYFWKMTGDTLSLTCPAPPTLDGRPWWRYPSYREIDVLARDGFQQLQTLLRAYKTEHDELELAQTCFRTTSWDPQVSQHPVNKLTVAFMNALIDEMELIQGRLDRARFEKMRLSRLKTDVEAGCVKK